MVGVYFYDRIYGIAVWPDGKIIAAGKKDHQFGLIKYNEDGTLDFGFGNQGKLAFSSAVGGTYMASACDVALTWDGKIVVAGTQETDHTYMVVGKLHANGTWDNTFGNGGLFSIASITIEDAPKNMVLQPDGKILVAGTGNIAGDPHFLLARFLPSFDMDIVEFSTENSKAFVYPNPVGSFSTLRYTLSKASQIHIELYDSQGHMVMQVLPRQQQDAGEQEITINWPQDLAMGNYYLLLNNPNGSTGIHIVKAL